MKLNRIVIKLLSLVFLMNYLCFSNSVIAKELSASAAKAISQIKIEGITKSQDNYFKNNQEKLSAYDRVKKIANSEGNIRISGGFTKLSIGIVSLLFGGRIIASNDSSSGVEWAATAYKGIGLVLSVSGLGLTFWGISDVWFNQTDAEKNIKELEKVDQEPREQMAKEYLREKAYEARQEKQQNNIFNMFGLIQKPESEYEKEYKEYLKDQSSH